MGHPAQTGASRVEAHGYVTSTRPIVRRLRAAHAEIEAQIARRKRQGSEKGSEKSSEKIMAVIREHPAASAQQIADIVGLSARAVEKHLSNLKVKGVLKRVGPDKGGRWELQGGA